MNLRAEDDLELQVPDGWFERHTGGGCMAWEKRHDHENDFEIWITDLCGSWFPQKDTEYIIVGFHLHTKCFKDSDPPEIPALEAMIAKQEGDPELHKYHVNDDYFSYGIDLAVNPLAQVIEILNKKSNITFISEVVLGLTKTEGDENL